MGLHRFFQRRNQDAELTRELEAHIAHQVDENISTGMSEKEARRQAHLKLGSPRRVREDVWHWNSVRFVDDLLQDLRYVLRTLRRMPGFTAVALLTLALGSGATTVMFTVINGVLLKPLPYPNAGRLVKVEEQTKGQINPIWGDRWAFAYPNFLDCKSGIRSLDMAAWTWRRGTVSDPGEAEYVEGVEMSSELFPVLGVTPVQGRAFLREDDRPGAAPVAIISYGLWQRHYGGSPAVVGRPLVFDGKPYTVAGIAPAGLQLFGQLVDVFTPLGQDTSPSMQNRKRHPGINVFSRLRPGVTLAEAQTELALIGQNLAEQYPDSNAGRGFVVEPLRPEVGNVRSTLWLLLGAVGLVLLIACANVANLLLARAVSRDREFAVRVALGAGRGRLARQCLTESTVLGLSGGALGVALAAVGIHPFVQFWPGSLPRAEDVQLDWHVLLFALVVSLLSGFLFGLAPALRAPVRDLEQVLRAGARTVTGNSRRLQSAFVVSELALAVVLLVSAGMLGRTLLRLYSLDPGVDIRNVLTARTALSPATLANPARIRAAWQDLLERARRVPGVQSIAMVDTVPMRDGNNPLAYWTTPALPSENQMPLALANSVTPDYLRVMSIPLRQGRFFNDQDRMDSELVVVIDDVMAQHAFAGQDAIGKSLWIPDMSPHPMKIVGIVGHVRYWGLAGDDQAQIRAQIYYPFGQVPDQFLRRWSELMSIAVRTSIPPMNVVETLRHEVRGANGDQVVYAVNTMEELASASIAQQRFLLLLFGIFAALALLLACVGIYGVLAYLTSQRTPEFGIRMALGANASDVLRLVLRQSFGMIALGAILGIVAAVTAVRLLEHLVPGVRSTDPLAFAAMILILVVAALTASFVPARRASRVDPMSALRQE
jgi:predicted permease